MTFRTLPYPGHTWSFTQHAVGLSSSTLYNFLQCAAPFEGEVENYDEKITSLMMNSGVLTANERDGSPDAWRDYQQILAELGLIFSTKICRALTFSDLGHMFLAGEIGFSELIGIQALRYQYPNGQKSTIQNRLRNELNSANLSLPQTLTELQINQQILIKPGLLILRILVELYEANLSAYLTTSECQAFLIPCRKNDEWPIAISELINHRKSPTEIDSIYRHSRRNIQDWFKFISKSDFFKLDDPNTIRLSSYSLSNIELIKNILSEQENPKSFWIPINFDINSRLDWFFWFGHAPFQMQSILRSDLYDKEYFESNYVAGIEIDEIDEASPTPTFSQINLKPLDLDFLSRQTILKSSDNIEKLAENIRQGLQKRHAKTLLHDRIVKKLAQNFISQGAQVLADSDSIDLLASWPNGSAIFEIKTVTRRSLQGQIRSAIGQVQEYDYRRQKNGIPPSDKVIVINTELENDAWQKDFLNDFLGIGLICITDKYYQGNAPTHLITKEYWVSQPTQST
jgi:hypothetical protein